MKKIKTVILTTLMVISLMILALVGSSCTKQDRVKNYGGTDVITLQPNVKLVNVTWKENDIWYLTRKMSATDIVEEYTFTESSDFGVFEGTIIIKETKTK